MLFSYKQKIRVFADESCGQVNCCIARQTVATVLLVLRGIGIHLELEESQFSSEKSLGM